MMEFRESSSDAPASPQWGACSVTAGRRLVRPAVMLLLAILAAGCGGVPDHSRYLPEDATFVVSVKPGQMMEKLEYEDFLRDRLIKKALLDLQDDRDTEILAEWIREPEELGLDLDETAYFFAEMSPSQRRGHPPETILGFILPVRSRRAIEDAVGDLEKAAGEEIDLEEKDGFKAFLEQDEFVFGFNRDTLIVLIHPGYRRAGPDLGRRLEDMFEGRETFAEETELFTLHQRQEMDLGLWVDFEQVFDTFSALGSFSGIFLGLIQDFYPEEASTELLFNRGEVRLVTRSYFDDDAYPRLCGEGVDRKLVDVIPADSVGAVSLSLNMKELKELLLEEYFPKMERKLPFWAEMEREVQENLDMSLEDLLDIPSGEFTFAFTDFEMRRRGTGHRGYNRETPHFIVGAGIDDRKKFGHLMEFLDQEDALEEIEGEGLYLVQQKGAVFLTTSKHRRDLEDGDNDEPLKGERRKILKDHLAGFFLDPPRLAEILERTGEVPGNVTETLEQVREVSGISAMEGQIGRSTVTLYLEDEKENSLKSLADILLDLALELESL